LILGLANSTLAGDDQSVFRGSQWGMSADDIIVLEKQRNDSELVENGGFIIYYKMNIYDSEATVMYHVGLKGLEKIYIKIGRPAFKTQSLKDTFHALKAALNQKYGEMDWGRLRVIPDIWVLPNKVVMLLMGDPVTISYRKPDPSDPKPLASKVMDFSKYLGDL
jgi:hypothetical protein